MDAVEIQASAGRVSVSDVNARTILTPASGFIRRYKFTLNPYAGCAFGCEYCYARFFVADVERRDTWGEWVAPKRNAAELLARACTSGKLRTGDAIYMSSVTDPYQPVERRLRLTRAVLETLLEHGVQPRLTIQTRSPLSTRDIDPFRQFDRIRVNFTIGTDSDEVRRRYEPRCPSIDRRFSAAAEVAAAGVPIGVSISPMLPLRNIEAFAQRLLALKAAEYVTQYLRPAGATVFGREHRRCHSTGARRRVGASRLSARARGHRASPRRAIPITGRRRGLRARVRRSWRISRCDSSVARDCSLSPRRGRASRRPATRLRAGRLPG